MVHHIARFNPYNMDDETVLAVATGRQQPLSVVLETLADNLQGNEQQHLMVVGPRGRGKSFFLKYLRIMFERDERFQHCHFISLPEEQSNVRFASDLVRMILSQINGEGFRSVTPLWREPEELWQKSVAELEAYCRQQAKAHEGKFLLVVVVENFQSLLERLDETGQHRIRHLMEHLPQFTLIGATPFARVDSDYNRPIFHIFKEIQILPWTEEDYLKYFRRRRQMESQHTGRRWTDAEIRFKEAKLRAISQYTGGSPRMAVVLTNLLLSENVVSTARTLYGLVDELTPYYQDLVKDIPSNSLALFDALIRLGENLSQSELAAQLGAGQNDISKAFRWLQDNGYVVGAKRTKSKEFRYAVSDRVFVLYYMRREVYHDTRYTPVWLLADFLTVFYSEEELHRHALYHLIAEPSADAEDLLRVWMRKKGMREGTYSHDQNVEELLEAGGITDSSFEEVALEIFKSKKWNDCLRYCEGLLAKPNGEVNASILILKGLALFETKSFELGIECFQKVFAIGQLEGDIEKQALSLEAISWSLLSLERHIEAIEQHKKALSIRQQQGNKEREAFGFEGISLNLQALGCYTEAIENHHKALLIREEMNDMTKQDWNLGQVSINHLLLNQDEIAWSFWKNKSQKSPKAFGQWGCGIHHLEKTSGIATAFALASRILHRLPQEVSAEEIPMLLTSFFVELIVSRISETLLCDIVEEARQIFPEPAQKVVLEATLQTAYFAGAKPGGQVELYLEKLRPDMNIFTRAIWEAVARRVKPKVQV